MSSIFNNDNKDKFQIIAMTKDGGGERRTTCLKEADGSLLDLEHLREELKTLLESRKDDLTKVISFGAGLLDGSDAAFGFMVGWVTKTIIEAYEHSQMKNGEHPDDVHISVSMDTDDLSRDDVIDDTIEQAEKFIKFMKENRDNPDIKLNGLGNPIKSDIDGTDGYA